MSRPTTDGIVLEDAGNVRQSVSEYYGQTLQSSADLKTNACCTAKPPPKEVREVLAKVPGEVVARYYGCGSPFPPGLSGQPLAVLDLGCGSGRDCYVCAALVGPQGRVTGVDMTPEQLAVAKQHADAWATTLGYPASNMTFLQGTIEALGAAGVAPGSQDLVISNCVLNLSADKGAVLAGVAAALKEGGEMYFSDVYCDRRLPADVRAHPVLLGECLGGALYVNDFLVAARQAGFEDPRVVEASEVVVHDPQLSGLLGSAAFYSITFRLFKLPGLDAWSEDYGQAATYKGSLPGCGEAYTLDAGHVFRVGESVRVCRNTAAMLQRSWLGPHFEVTGDTSHHRGMFCTANECSLSAASVATMVAAQAGSSGAGGCCPPASTGGCCPPVAASKGNGCCPAPPAATNGGCCPAPPASRNSGCCPAPPASSNGGSCKPSGGCC